MKFLVLAVCIAASSAAPQGFYGLQAHPNGAVTPIDEPAVQAARAEHLATKFGAGAAGPLGYAGVGPAAYSAVAPATYAAGPYAAAEYGYAGPIHVPTLVAHPNGAVTPVDEPAVQAARAEHFAAQGAQYALNAPVIAHAAPAAAYGAGYGYAGPIHVPTLIAHPNGAVTPADEPAVQAARAEHFAAKGAQYAVNAPVYGGAYAAGPAYAGYAAPYAGLVAHPNGAVVPVDEPAVQAARAQHFATKGAVY